jgi:hypothetical protein
MRGYPRGLLTKQDYENLLSMPEHADRAATDLAALAKLDDSKITIDQGTAEKPKLVEIANPMPTWKRAGFTTKAELVSMTKVEIAEPIAEKV